MLSPSSLETVYSDAWHRCKLERKRQASTGRADSGIGNGAEGPTEDEVGLHVGPASHSIVTIYGIGTFVP
jgi:hypothetical protein